MLVRLTVLALAGSALTGCYGAVTASAVATTFVPDPAIGAGPLVVGRDCSFHFGGMPWRDLDAREAARNALLEVPAVALDHVTIRVVYPAPFEVCLELEGVARGAHAHAAGAEHPAL